MGSKDLIDMVVYGVLAAVPYLDLDILGVIAGIPLIGNLISWIPYIEPINLSNLDSTDFVILLILVIVPYVDLEVFKLAKKLGISGFESFDLTSEVRERAQGSYVDENGEIVMADGGVRNAGNHRGSSSRPSSFIMKLLMIGGPIAIVMFLVSSGYFDLGVDQLAFQVGGLNTPEIGATVAQGMKTLECVGNAACVRQWQFNNTQRPGSTEEGKEFNLQIKNFDVNDGFPLDVADRRADDRVPVDFTVNNPRHGLKGIEAHNVAYRIAVYDSTGSLLDDPECQTGWQPLGGEYANNDFGQNGTILPGGFATPLGTHSDLTIRECGMLQPALGVNRQVRLQLAYDYSSQSTLQVQAMSRDNMLSLEERPSFKESETADTPVKTYVNVESPITYRDNEDTGAESSVFGLRVGFETGQRDIKYRVHTEGFQLYDSGETIDVDNTESIDSGAVSCEDMRLEGTDQYDFSSEMTDYLNSRQSNSWFESNSGPSPARCSMVLEDPGSISPTGETLTFRIDANYTVLLEEVVEGFKVQNSKCSQYNCPMLVPQSHEEVQKGNLISSCESRSRVDANDGCTARNGDQWPDTAEDYALKEEVDSEIEEGETAVRWQNVLSAVNDEMPSAASTFEYQSEEIDSDTVVGVSLSSFTDVNTGVVGLRTSNGDLDFREVNYQICASEGDLKNSYPEQSGYGDNLIFSSIYKADCGNVLEGYLDSNTCQKGWRETLGDIADLDGAAFDSFSASCQQALREYRECDQGITGVRPQSNELTCISSGN